MIKTIENKRLGVSCKYIEHSSGLKIYLMNIKGVSSTRAIFGTAYGSIDTHFSKNGGEAVSVPEGIAHFLEHKLFESETVDAFELFSKTGAYSNAYTSFDRTCYLFNCTENLEENLKILLGFVQSPYFTEETVKKEQGIIGQEIQMYLDSPDWRVLFNLFGALYKNNPVRIDIAGTRESISNITAELLYSCYETFYNPNNMFFVLAGDFSEDKVLEIIDSELKPAATVTITRHSIKEPESVVTDYTEQALAVAKSMFMVGFKVNCNGYADAKERLSMELGLDILFGKSSRLYKNLRDKELISNTLDYEYFCTRDTATAIIGGESDNPREVKEQILSELERVAKEGLDPDVFEAALKSAYGERVVAFDRVEGAVSVMVESTVSGGEVFEEIELLPTLTLSDVQEALGLLKESNCSLSVISPNSK